MLHTSNICLKRFINIIIIIRSERVVQEHFSGKLITLNSIRNTYFGRC